MRVWIKDFPGYKIDDEGNVWSFWQKNGRSKAFIGSIGKKLKLTFARRYIQVTLHKDGKLYCRRVHLLVLAAFIGPKPDGMLGCHNDSNPLNNRMSNLRYDTPSGNYKDRYANGTHNSGERHGQAKLTEKDIYKILEELRSGVRQVDIANRHGVSQVNISRIKLGRVWKHLPRG